MILNKFKIADRVRVKTIDAEAKAGHDYDSFDKVISFKNGEAK